MRTSAPGAFAVYGPQQATEGTLPGNATGDTCSTQSNRITKTEYTKGKPKWYSPQLSREVVSRLYHKAKAERISMTLLVNQLIEETLES